MPLWMSLLLMVAWTGAHLASPSSLLSPDLTVINSLGPVRNNETVVSFVPNFLQAGGDDIVTHVRVCTAYSTRQQQQQHQQQQQQCLNITPTRIAAGVVHWLLSPPTTSGSMQSQLQYSICIDTGKCGPVTKLNAAEPWWIQCVGSMTSIAGFNGMSCIPGSILRVFGKALAFDQTTASCLEYKPYTTVSSASIHSSSINSAAASSIRLTSVEDTSKQIVLPAVTQSCYDSTFNIPSSVSAGNYTIEYKSNLVDATWEPPRDPDQYVLSINALTNPYGTVAMGTAPRQPICSPSKTTAEVQTKEELFAAIAQAGNSSGGITILVDDLILLGASDILELPDCTILQGKSSTAKLQWIPDHASMGIDCGKTNKPLIGTASLSAGQVTIQDLQLEAIVLQGCGGLIGAGAGVGFTMRNLNVTSFAPMLQRATFSSLVNFNHVKNFLIEDCTFLHCGNNTPGDAHAGVNAPILSISAGSDGAIRNNLWQVGLSGWHLDQSWHVIHESNTYTGYFDNDKSKPLPNFDGSFWFSSYGQGPFPGAGRYFYANNTQNERPHSIPQVGGGESWTLDGGNDGGYYGTMASPSLSATNTLLDHGAIVNENTLTLASDACWKHVGGYTAQNCSTVPAVPGGKTGHAVQILEGPAKGQWRRIIGIGGYRNRTITLDRPFNPIPTPTSILQVGPMRGQILIVGNNFLKGGIVQLYAACYDCLVAENIFTSFGFANWGRAPHGVGWQPNLNNLIVDNLFEPVVPTDLSTQRGLQVLACSATCSGKYNINDDERTCYPANTHAQTGGWVGCSGNSTSMLGRDCTPFAVDGIGNFKGSINIQLAWRRNNAAQLLFGNPNPTVYNHMKVPFADGGVIEHNINVNLTSMNVENFNQTKNIVLRP